MNKQDEHSLIRKLTDTAKKKTEPIIKTPEEEIIQMFGRTPLKCLDKISLKSYFHAMRSNDRLTYVAGRRLAENLLEARKREGYNIAMAVSLYDSINERQSKRFGE